MGTGYRFVCLLALGLLCNLGATSDAAAWWGPNKVGYYHYSLPDALDIGPVQDVDLRAQVTYPATSDGKNTPIAPGGPFPLVAVLHGNHDAPYWNYKGFQYFTRDLASLGFVVFSIDANELAGPEDHIEERAYLVLKHLQLWSNWSAESGHFFFGQVDMDKIVLIGHSRGGEAMVAANKFNQSRGLGYGIRAVAAMAPTDFNEYPINNVPFFVIVGSSDEQLWELPGFRIYDRAKKTHKSALYLIGANHLNFNWVWRLVDEGFGEPRISGNDQRLVAKHYLIAFCLYEIWPSQFAHLRSVFTGESEFPALAGLEIHKQYLDETHLDVDHFEDVPHNVLLNSMGMENEVLGLEEGEEWDLRSQLTPGNHQTWAGHFQWLRAGETGFRLYFPGCFDASGYDYLSFRVGQVHSTPDLNPPGWDKHFPIGVQDCDAGYFSSDVSEFGRIPYPYGGELPEKGWVERTVMNTIRVPMAAIQAAGVDTSRLYNIDFGFGLCGDCDDTGDVVLDDVGFTD